MLAAELLKLVVEPQYLVFVVSNLFGSETFGDDTAFAVDHTDVKNRH